MKIQNIAVKLALALTPYLSGQGAAMASTELCDVKQKVAEEIKTIETTEMGYFNVYRTAYNEKVSPELGRKYILALSSFIVWPLSDMKYQRQIDSRAAFLNILNGVETKKDIKYLSREIKDTSENGLPKIILSPFAIDMMGKEIRELQSAGVFCLNENTNFDEVIYTLQNYYLGRLQRHL